MSPFAPRKQRYVRGATLALLSRSERRQLTPVAERKATPVVGRPGEMRYNRVLIPEVTRREQVANAASTDRRPYRSLDAGERHLFRARAVLSGTIGPRPPAPAGRRLAARIDRHAAGAHAADRSASPAAGRRARRPGADGRLRAPAHTRAWRHPVDLRLHTVCWSHGTAASIAYVPALDIEVVAATPEELAARIEDHVRFALLRTKQGESLEDLTWLQRCEAVEIETVTLAVDVKTPKQIAQAEQGRKKSVLKEVADPASSSAPAFGLDEIVGRMADWLRGQRPRSILLTGPSGVGKTAAVGELARQQAEYGLSARPFWSTSGSRLVAGMTGFGMWQEALPRAVRGGRPDQSHCPLRQLGRARAGGPVVQLYGRHRPVPAALFRPRRVAGHRRVHARAAPTRRARHAGHARRLRADRNPRAAG